MEKITKRLLSPQDFDLLHGIDTGDPSHDHGISELPDKTLVISYDQLEGLQDASHDEREIMMGIEIGLVVSSSFEAGFYSTESQERTEELDDKVRKEMEGIYNTWSDMLKAEHYFDIEILNDGPSKVEMIWILANMKAEYQVQQQWLHRELAIELWEEFMRREAAKEVVDEYLSMLYEEQGGPRWNGAKDEMEMIIRRIFG